MIEIEQRITNDIASHRRVKLFWDMDGTCASMEMHRKEQKLEKGFFSSKRPIKTMIALMERFHNLGAELYILSFCSYYYQKDDKIYWLRENCSFISEENYIIIPRRESNVRQAASKQQLKAAYLKDYISEDDVVYMIDDNESVLLATQEILPWINIVSPIDFVE